MSSTLDPDLVTTILREHLHPDAVCTATSRAAVGNSQETWFISVDGVKQPTSLVLRRTAAAGTIDWSDRGLEVAVLKAASAAGLPVPRVWWWEAEGSPLERPYAMMDRAPGNNPDLRNPEICSTLATDLGCWLAKLHTRTQPPDELETPRTVADATRTQLNFWVERARKSELAPPIAAALCGWLAANIPSDEEQPVLLWGDPGPHNVLTDSHGEITALLDWELAHVGHPLFDLGAARWACLGHLDRELLTSSYEEHSEISIDRNTLDWFEVLACVSRSVMLFDGVNAVLAGESQDPNLIALGHAMVSANMLRSAQLAWGLTSVVGEIAIDDQRRPTLRPLPAERDEALARFLDREVLPALTDSRLRRGVKVAAALLSMPPDHGVGEANVEDPWTSYDSELQGRATKTQRQSLIRDMELERQSQLALLDLYGPTVAVHPHDSFKP